MNKKLFDKYLANRCSEEEVEEVFRYFQDPSESNFTKENFSGFWESIPEGESLESENDSKQLDRIHHTINLNQSTERKKRELPPIGNINRRIYGWFYRAAAILIVPLIIFSIYSVLNFNHVIQSHTSNYEVVAPVGGRIHFPLPDGTIVWLNQGSKLVYPNSFIGDSRIVKLQGEGYFEVSHNEKIPFIVETGGLAVKAVGTSFNVKAYKGADFETALEAGKVIMLDEKKNGGFEELCEMKPGERFVYNDSTHSYEVNAENLLKYVSWREGKLVFEDDNMKQVIKRLEQWYNAKITLQDRDLESLTYTGTFVDETLDQVLDLMVNITPIDYEAVKRKDLGNGKFSEKEILIFKKKEVKRK